MVKNKYDDLKTKKVPLMIIILRNEVDGDVYGKWWR